MILNIFSKRANEKKKLHKASTRSTLAATGTNNKRAGGEYLK